MCTACFPAKWFNSWMLTPLFSTSFEAKPLGSQERVTWEQEEEYKPEGISGSLRGMLPWNGEDPKFQHLPPMMQQLCLSNAVYPTSIKCNVHCISLMQCPVSRYDFLVQNCQASSRTTRKNMTGNNISVDLWKKCTNQINLRIAC